MLPKKSDTKNSGDLGEEIAYNLLKKSGYKILIRNFRTKFAEIDIIATYENTLIFVEVKTRWSRRYGLPEEAVNKNKLAKIEKAGQLFKLQNKSLPDKMRVDVVAIDMTKKNGPKSKIIKVV